MHEVLLEWQFGFSTTGEYMVSRMVTLGVGTTWHCQFPSATDRPVYAASKLWRCLKIGNCTSLDEC